QSAARAIAPADQRGLLQLQRIHDTPHVGCNELVSIGLLVARATAMPTGIDDHRAIASLNKSRNLIPPVATVAEAAVQQDHRSPRSVRCVPDSSASMHHVGLCVGSW